MATLLYFKVTDNTESQRHLIDSNSNLRIEGCQEQHFDFRRPSGVISFVPLRHKVEGTHTSLASHSRGLNSTPVLGIKSVRTSGQ